MHDKLYFLLGYLARLGYVRFVDDDDIEWSIAYGKEYNCNTEQDIVSALETLNFKVIESGDYGDYDYSFKIKNGEETFNLFVIELQV